MKTSHFVVLVLVLVAYNSDGCYIKTDGCTTPWPNFPFRQTFKPACIRHDVCYRCGVKYGWSQQQCDRAFYNHMGKICRRVGNAFCQHFRTKYFNTVKLVGHLFYRKKPMGFCNNPCVIGHGYPG